MVLTKLFTFFQPRASDVKEENAVTYLCYNKIPKSEANADYQQLDTFVHARS